MTFCLFLYQVWQEIDVTLKYKYFENNLISEPHIKISTAHKGNHKRYSIPVVLGTAKQLPLQVQMAKVEW